MSALNNTNKLFIVLFSCIGIAVLGLQAPAIVKQRNTQQDAKTSTDLLSINIAVESKGSSDSKLPEKLSDLNLDGDIKSRLSKYEYNPKINGVDYELCAVFKADTTKPKVKSASDDYAGSSSITSNDYYSHHSGRVCFTSHISTYSSFDDTSNSQLSTRSTTTTSSTFSGIQAKAKDTEIQTDINTIHSKLEEYFNATASYPSLSQLKDSKWRSVNLVGIDEEAVKGPNGETLGSGYNYTATPTACDNTGTSQCDGYMLSAKLSTGSSYTKYSLN